MTPDEATPGQRVIYKAHSEFDMPEHGTIRSVNSSGAFVLYDKQHPTASAQHTRLEDLTLESPIPTHDWEYKVSRTMSIPQKMLMYFVLVISPIFVVYDFFSIHTSFKWIPISLWIGNFAFNYWLWKNEKRRKQTLHDQIRKYLESN